MLLKTNLIHLCVKAKCPTSLKSISVFVYISTGAGRCVCASGLSIKLHGAAFHSSPCLGKLHGEKHGYLSQECLTSSVSVSLQQLSKATEGDFSEGRLDISCAVLGDAHGSETIIAGSLTLGD